MINNGMNPMGMNYDATAMKLKNIIQTYENKIKELEEVIRQKDFEIAVLKQKLNNSNNNMMNPMDMNMINQIYMNNMPNVEQINNTMNQINFHNKKEVLIRVDLENNSSINIQCFEDDKLSILRQKCNKIKGALSCLYEPLNENLTIKDIIEKYGYSIDNKQTKFISATFVTVMGSRTQLILDENCPIGIAIIHYFIKCNFIRGILHAKLKKLRFIYNAIALRLEDNTPIKEIFKNCGREPTVVINDIDNLVGG